MNQDERATLADAKPGRRHNWFLGLFLSAAAIFVAAGLFRSWGRLQALGDEVTGYSWRFSAGWLTATVVIWLLPLLGSAAVWVWLYRRAGGDVGFRAGILAWRATSLGRYIPGKIWQLTGLAAYVRQRKASGALAISCSLQVQILTLLAGLAVAAAFLGGGLGTLGRPGWQLAALVAGLLVLLQPRVIGAIGRLLGRWLGEELPSERLRIQELGPAGLGLTGVWLLYGLGFAAFLRGVAGLEIQPGQATGIFTASYLAGFVLFVAPAGLVAREAAMTALLVTFLHLPTAVAAMIAIAARIGVTVAELLAVLLAWLLAFSARASGSATSPSAGSAEPADPATAVGEHRSRPGV